MITTILDQPALILGKLYRPGEAITVANQAVLDAGIHAASRLPIRDAIEKQAGDTLTLLGTTSDSAQVVLIAFAELIDKLSDAGSLAEVRDAAEPHADWCRQLLAKVNSGEVVMPFQAKGGIPSVMPEIEQRATRVAKVVTS